MDKNANGMKTSEVLDTAAVLIEVNGWTTGAWGEVGSSMCLEGGILAAMDVEDNFQSVVNEYQHCPAFNAVRRYLRDNNLIDPNTDALNSFNDGAEGTQESVTEVLRKTAEVERAKGD